MQDLGSCAARREGSSPFFRSMVLTVHETYEYKTVLYDFMDICSFVFFILEKNKYVVYDNIVNILIVSSRIYIFPNRGN